VCELQTAGGHSLLSILLFQHTHARVCVCVPEKCHFDNSPLVALPAALPADLPTSTSIVPQNENDLRAVLALALLVPCRF